MKEMDFSRDFLPPAGIDDPPIFITRRLKPSMREMVAALEWYRRMVGEDGRLQREDLKPSSFGRLIHHASLFGIIRDDEGRAIDLHARVFAGAMVRIYGEISGSLTSEKLPPVVQQRFLHHVNAMLEAGDVVMSRTQVAFADKTHISAEGLVIPVWKDGTIVQCLNFFSFR